MPSTKPPSPPSAIQRLEDRKAFEEAQKEWIAEVQKKEKALVAVRKRIKEYMEK